jgi:hypothetical protein
MTLGFRREADENCALLGYYAESSSGLLPTFRDNLSAHLQGSRIRILTLEGGTGQLTSRFHTKILYDFFFI